MFYTYGYVVYDSIIMICITVHLLITVIWCFSLVFYGDEGLLLFIVVGFVYVVQILLLIIIKLMQEEGIIGYMI